jgi:UPF0755 protein
MSFARRLVSLLLGVVIAALLCGGAVLWFVRTVTGEGPLAAPTTVVIAPGSGLARVAHQLRDAGVIDAAWMFEVEARYTDQARALKPGEYRFDAGVSLDEALRKIVRHDVVIRFVTVPEGLVTADVLKIVGAAEGLQGALPAVNGEGMLLPETYRYEWGDQRAAVIGRMESARNAALQELWAGRDPAVQIATPEQALVLASIVEKETGVAAERPRVAAVFLNRLKHGMKLQSDPTVIYGLGQDGRHRALSRADLAQATPYNTYVIAGLPPGPICNPGKASIAAVLHPADTQDLYFVADGTGGHSFAASLDEHNRNVARWRAGSKKNVDAD